MRLTYHLYLLLLLLFLTSCATTPLPEATTKTFPSWNTRKATLSHLTNWNLKAAIAMKTPKESGSANLAWEQRAKNYTLSMWGPLGSNAMTLKGSPGKVSLSTANGQTFEATSPEALLAKQFGWHLPVSHLYYWIRGL